MNETAIKSLESKYPAFLSHFRSEVIDADDFRGDLAVTVRPARIVEILSYLKAHEGSKFEILMDLFGVDYLKYTQETPERFAVVYILFSVTRNEHLRLKVYLPEEKCQIPTACKVYKAANWFEREAWDMFGIEFIGHPNLVRILCHTDFEGHALRKDYPSDYYQRLKSAATSAEF